MSLIQSFSIHFSSWVYQPAEKVSPDFPDFRSSSGSAGVLKPTVRYKFSSGLGSAPRAFVQWDISVSILVGADQGRPYKVPEHLNWPFLIQGLAALLLKFSQIADHLALSLRVKPTTL